MYLPPDARISFTSNTIGRYRIVGTVPERHGGIGTVTRAGDEGQDVPGLHVQLLLALPLSVGNALLSTLR